MSVPKNHPVPISIGTYSVIYQLIFRGLGYLPCTFFFCCLPVADDDDDDDEKQNNESTEDPNGDDGTDVHWIVIP